MPNNSTKTKKKEFQFQLSNNTPSLDAAWYIINTYSGHEYKVIDALKTRVKTMGLEDYIFQAIVPIQSKMVIRRGNKVKTQEKTFPGYVLIQMIVTDDSWYVVRNTPNVTGFVGSGTIPLPVSLDEMASLKKRVEVEEPKYNIDFSVGDAIKITDGPFKDSDGKVSGIDKERGKVKVLINMFGRDTPLELDSLQIKKI